MNKKSHLAENSHKDIYRNTLILRVLLFCRGGVLPLPFFDTFLLSVCFRFKRSCRVAPSFCPKRQKEGKDRFFKKGIKSPSHTRLLCYWVSVSRGMCPINICILTGRVFLVYFCFDAKRGFLNKNSYLAYFIPFYLGALPLWPRFTHNIKTALSEERAVYIDIFTRSFGTGGFIPRFAPLLYLHSLF